MIAEDWSAASLNLGRAASEDVAIAVGSGSRKDGFDVVLAVVVTEEGRVDVVEAVGACAQVSGGGVDGVPGVVRVGEGVRRPVGGLTSGTLDSVQPDWRVTTSDPARLRPLKYLPCIVRLSGSSASCAVPSWSPRSSSATPGFTTFR